ncbi:uncharacterized protein LOC115313586 [Ixodes scapularis]|uniref:uncharacterized protein LOC115313586 n=1 Tax=Ixodes scapularis TaxID=6945 RepID=UPI001A9E937A|nr:uncharacterized protein LOC115313586 [Ixodes scapularis]
MRQGSDVAVQIPSRNERASKTKEKHLFYTNETWVNAGHKVGQVWVDTDVTSAPEAKRSGLSTGLQNSTGKGGRLIVTHCGNENGFVLGAGEVFCARKGTEDYHDEMDRVHYHKWFTQKLLPALPPGNVIFIDSAPFHSVKEEKVLCMSSLKKDIEARFSKKGVTWSTDMVKAELMKLVNAVKVEGDTYRIDTIASEAGHTVVRLPPYHC